MEGFYSHWDCELTMHRSICTGGRYLAAFQTLATSRSVDANENVKNIDQHPAPTSCRCSGAAIGRAHAQTLYFVRTWFLCLPIGRGQSPTRGLLVEVLGLTSLPVSLTPLGARIQKSKELVNLVPFPEISTLWPLDFIPYSLPFPNITEAPLITAGEMRTSLI